MNDHSTQLSPTAYNLSIYLSIYLSLSISLYLSIFLSLLIYREKDITKGTLAIVGVGTI